MSQTHKLNIAAIQMNAVLADVGTNLKKIEKLIFKAAEQKADWVILPEFFTSACAFHPKMLDAIITIGGEATTLLNKISQELEIVIGGSFIAKHNDAIYNTFILVFPDGTIHQHNKDIPTMWENCYYIGGNDAGILDTTIGPIGVALCWEMLRTQTAKRLLGKVKFIVSGSCWWDLPESAPENFNSLRQKSLQMLQTAPVTFAKLLGVPIIHAGHAGDFEGYAAPSETKKYKSRYLGETCIVDGQGNILASLDRNQGEGIIIKEIDINSFSMPSMNIPNSFWIPKMPKAFLKEWDVQNKFGQKYYRNKTIKYLSV